MVHVDYVTLTSKFVGTREIPIPEQYLEKRFHQWIAGPAVYQGHTYRYSSGNLHILFSELQGLLIRCSGGFCEFFVKGIDLEKFNCRRLDLAADVYQEMDLEYWYRYQKSKSSKIKASLINGETLYIGSRKSFRFWRIYNKALEQGWEDKILYRLECELKGIRAKQAASCINSDERLFFFKKNAIGVISELLDIYYPNGQEGLDYDLTIPRGRPAGMYFLKKVIVPFLKNNAWAVSELEKEGLFQ